MRPALDHLEALLWIARLGSFRSAAQRLHLSQPAISGRIRELESALGFAVIDRAGRRRRITPEGLEVVRYAEQMIGLAENFRARFTERRLDPISLRLGVSDSFAMTHLSPLMRRIAEFYPGTRVDLDIGFSADLDRKLQADALDIAFLTSPTSNAAVRIEPLEALDLAWLASPRLRLHGRRFEPGDLIAHPILTNPRPSHLYGTILDWFAKAGVAPDRLHTCTSLTLIAKLAADGLGIAVLPPNLVRRELARGTLRAIATNPQLPLHYTSVAYRVDEDRAEASAVIARLAQDLAGH